MDKRCKHCGEQKDVEDFYADAACRDGRRPECKACTAAKRKRWYQSNREREIARVKAWQQANPDRVQAAQRKRRERPEVKAKERAGHLKRTFNITQERYEELLAAQGGGCAVCGKKPKPGKSLHVDHDHGTGAVRGLLCFSCNAALGHLHDDHERLQTMIAYLVDHDPEMVELAEITARRLASLTT